MAAGAVGFFAYRYSHPAPEPVIATAAPVVTPDPAAPEESKKTVPDSLPDITLADRDGKPTKLASFGGRPLMVNFWATWCAPCRREIPLLNKIRTQRQAQNG